MSTASAPCLREITAGIIPSPAATPPAASAVAQRLSQALHLGEDLLGIAGAGIGRRAVIELQAGFEAAFAVDEFAQYPRAGADIGDRVEQRLRTAQGAQLVRIHARDDLHQALGAGDAFGDRIEAGLD